MTPSSDSISRRSFVSTCAGTLAASTLLPELVSAQANTPVAHQAMGTRVGEITQDSAVVWTRLSAAATRNRSGQLIPGRAQDHKEGKLPVPSVPADQLEGACAGMPGRVRLRYGVLADLSDAQTTPWAEVGAQGDFIHKFSLNGLRPATLYHYESQTCDASGAPHAPWRGTFQTAPAPAEALGVSFCVMTCQGYPDRGHADGHAIYPAMQALKPAFACLTGDLVYYDNDMPQATTPELARYHWQRMFSLPRLVDFCSHVGTYWLKDDHDTLNNDSWPGQQVGDFTFEEGRKIFQQQAPMGEGLPYRTFRWGRDLQIWLTEGRDFRSPNSMRDGPDKTIWGKEQKVWFQKTVKESDATWKILISPTPLVGPDRASGKNDNHANPGFRHEGDEIRAWLKANVADHFFVICGDRHWQYHSVHPVTGLHEFCPGAASDEHAGGSPGLKPEYHRFHKVNGGFLSTAVSREGGNSRILFRHHDGNGAVVYEWSTQRKA